MNNSFKKFACEEVARVIKNNTDSYVKYCSHCLRMGKNLSTFECHKGKLMENKDFQKEGKEITNGTNSPKDKEAQNA